MTPPRHNGTDEGLSEALKRLEEEPTRDRHPTPCQSLRDHLAALVSLAKDVARVQMVMAGAVALVITAAGYLYARQDGIIEAQSKGAVGVAELVVEVRSVKESQARMEATLNALVTARAQPTYTVP